MRGKVLWHNDLYRFCKIEDERDEKEKPTPPIDLGLQSQQDAMAVADPRPKIPPPRSALPPPQFGLRTLLLVVTACAVVAALSQWVTPVVLACLAFLILSIIAHVAGNAIGTRLRDLSSHSPDDALPKGLFRAKPKADDFAPATRLGQRHGLGWPILVATVVGTVGGAVGGVAWTLISSRGPVGLLNVGVGAIAFAVLGGIAAFASFGFIQVGLGAIRQALAEHKN